jgi:hypothetical protein
MTNDTSWITARIAEAVKQDNSLTGAVTSQMEALLNEILSEAPLPPTELSNIAKALIRDMVPAPSEANVRE